jgi:hypothetical protein
MNKLSPSLQYQITRHLFLNVITNHEVFHGVTDIFEFILESIEAVQYLPDQYIIKEGTKPTHLYILESG